MEKNHLIKQYDMLIEKMTLELLETIYKEHKRLMASIQKILWDENQKESHTLYYNSMTHSYLEEKAWDVQLPVPKEEWFTSLEETRYEKQMPWPQSAAYQYGMDVLHPPHLPIGSLYFGYAVLEDNTVRKTCFFGWLKMVEYQVAPQAIAMDPLALLHNIPVKYYVGVAVEEVDLQNFVSRIIPGNPLENFVKRKREEEHEKDLDNTRMQSYDLQIYYEPHYFPKELIEFANRKGLYVPEDQRSSN